MVNIKICGSCVSRDTFGFHQYGEFTVKEFIHFSSPLSMIQKPVKRITTYIVEQEKEFIEKSAFVRKSILRDVTKTAIKILEEANADWLIVDISHIRHMLLKIIDRENNELLVTFSKEARKDLERMFFNNEEFTTQIIKPWEWEEEQIEKEMYIFSEKLKEVQEETKIILIELENTNFYIKKEGKLQAFSRDCFEVNQFIRKCFKYLRKYLPKAYVIPFPKDVIADECHKWGLFQLHFVDEYYDYTYQAMKMITSKSNREEIESLYKKVDNYFTEMFYEKIKVKDIIQNATRMSVMVSSNDVMFNEKFATKRGAVSLTKNGEIVHLGAYINLKKGCNGDVWIMRIPKEYCPQSQIEKYGYIACGCKYIVTIEMDGAIFLKQIIEHDVIGILDLTWMSNSKNDII